MASRHCLFAVGLVLLSTSTSLGLKLDATHRRVRRGARGAHEPTHIHTHTHIPTPTLTPTAEGGKIATIIAMDIRFPAKGKHGVSDLVETLADINRQTSGTDVFICTDKQYEGLLVNFSNVKGVRFAEDDGGFTGLAKRQVKLRQWWRLQQCWQLVRSYEERVGQRYSFYFKMRTDCKYNSCPNSQQSFHEIARAHGQDLQHFAFLNTDLSFGAAPAVMERISTLYSRIETDYWGKDAMKLFELFPIDYDLLMRCDWSAGRFTWLPYPSDVMKGRCFSKSHVPLASKHMVSIKNCVNQRLPELKAFTQRRVDLNGTPVVTGLPSNLAISSERVLVLDLLLAGVEIHSYAEPFIWPDDDDAEFQHAVGCKDGQKSNEEVIEDFSLSPQNFSGLPPVESLWRRSGDACTDALPPSSLSAWNSSGEEWKRWLHETVDENTLKRPRMNVPFLWQASTSGSDIESVVVVVRNGKNRIASWMSEDPLTGLVGLGGLGLDPLLKCPLVKEIRLTWWPTDAPPLSFGNYTKDNTTVYVQDVSANMFTDRYDVRKLGLYDTSAEFMLSLDDDNSLTCDGLRTLLRAGRKAQTHIVTSWEFCRSAGYDAGQLTHTRIRYGLDPGNIALPGMGLLSMKSMRGYSDLILPRVKPIADLISALGNGEDFLLNAGFAAMSPDGLSQECIHLRPRQFIMLPSGGSGIHCARRPANVDRQVWMSRRDVVLNIVARAFSACTGFNGLSFKHANYTKTSAAGKDTASVKDADVSVGFSSFRNMSTQALEKYRELAEQLPEELRTELGEEIQRLQLRLRALRADGQWRRPMRRELCPQLLDLGARIDAAISSLDAERTFSKAPGVDLSICR